LRLYEQRIIEFIKLGSMMGACWYVRNSRLVLRS